MGTVEQAKVVAGSAARPAGGASRDGDVDQHVLARPPRPDWERLIEGGTVPALILGAERRLRRDR
jgi:hypothetical protein